MVRSAVPENCSSSLVPGRSTVPWYWTTCSRSKFLHTLPLSNSLSAWVAVSWFPSLSLSLLRRITSAKSPFGWLSSTTSWADAGGATSSKATAGTRAARNSLERLISSSLDLEIGQLSQYIRHAVRPGSVELPFDGGLQPGRGRATRRRDASNR